jgi:hypothetical protein
MRTSDLRAMQAERARVVCDEPVPDLCTLPDIEEEVAEGEEEETSSGTVFDEEDFFEAIDIMETAKLHLEAVLKFSKDLTPHRRRLMKTHCDDIDQFVDMFISKPEEK